MPRNAPQLPFLAKDPLSSIVYRVHDCLTGEIIALTPQ
jgi:hypothetical protein